MNTSLGKLSHLKLATRPTGMITMELFKYDKRVKLLRSLNLNLPTFGIFEGMQRFAILTEYLYPQYITWDRVTWRPRATPKVKLGPWWIYSILTILAASHFLFVGIHEIAAFRKVISLPQVLMLVVYLCFSFVSIASMLT